MIFTNSDGGARGNPGPGAIGVIVRDDDKILIKHSSRIGDNVTSNIAEYEALIKSLELASKLGDEVTCFLDSELVVNQLLGKYRVRNPRLLELFLKIQKMQEKFKTIKYIHVSRWNKYQLIVDEMLNQELDKDGYKRYNQK
jgi:ribonuclease HI